MVAAMDGLHQGQMQLTLWLHPCQVTSGSNHRCKDAGAAKPGTQPSRKASSKKARSKAPSHAESVSMDVDEPVEGTDVEDAHPNISGSLNKEASVEQPMEVDGPEVSTYSLLEGS